MAQAEASLAVEGAVGAARVAVSETAASIGGRVDELASDVGAARTEVQVGVVGLSLHSFMF